jgi:hypothetical protein
MVLTAIVNKFTIEWNKKHDSKNSISVQLCRVLGCSLMFM